MLFTLLAAFICSCNGLSAENNEIEEKKPMFAEIYRCYVKPDCEAQFQENWKIVANYFVKERGAQCRHKLSW
jgi:hypothetical protein